MKQRQINKNLLSKAILSTAIVMMGMMAIPAFAVVSFPPWNTMQEIPSWDAAQCSGSSKKCANANSNGQNDVIARSEQIVWNTAYARNNQQKNPNVLGTQPELITSVSVVKFKGSFTWNGQNTIAPLQSAYLEYGTDIYRKNGSNWDRVTGCYGSVPGNGPQSGSTIKTCQITNSGTNTYRLGGELRAVAPAYLIGPVNIVDFWTGSSYHADTTKLELCTGC